VAACVGFAGRLVGPKRDFAAYQDQLVVLQSQVTHRLAGSNLMVTVVGTLTNRSPFGWKAVELEAQHYDQKGHLIDVTPSDRYRESSVLPHSELGFKLEGRPAQPASTYASCRVFVRAATDIRAWP
jgi:hypothetical protein